MGEVSIILNPKLFKDNRESWEVSSLEPPYPYKRDNFMVKQVAMIVVMVGFLFYEGKRGFGEFLTRYETLWETWNFWKMVWVKLKMFWGPWEGLFWYKKQRNLQGFESGLKEGNS